MPDFLLSLKSIRYAHPYHPDVSLAVVPSSRLSRNREFHPKALVVAAPAGFPSHAASPINECIAETALNANRKEQPYMPLPSPEKLPAPQAYKTRFKRLPIGLLIF
ncbi:hypothetical protein WUBG_04538 [Wuchereria bancrofti]|uniref:Uncharacterized protein n=1 Tax=Wuchereria bancrofti TaxID=6293 RepID=J9BBR1_WUCBA|nr:hypothetical protein WUBG_04538 [Wuchereria bancrofti]